MDKKGRRPKRLPHEEQAMVDGGLMLYRIVVAIIARVVALGGTGKVAQLAKPDGQARLDQITQIIVGKAVEPIIQVAWELVLKFVIAACRFVSYVNSDINAVNFPYAPGDLDLKEIIIVTINRTMSTADILRLLDEKGLRPARLMELLFWWLTHPDKQANCLVAALGSVWRGRVPYVRGYGAYRRLDLYSIAGAWYQEWCFAAVRKSAA